MTGAAGYVAHWLIPELTRGGHTVVRTDRRGMRGLQRSLRRDLLQPHAFDTMLQVVRPDVVVHLAAKYGRLQGEVDPWETARLNAELSTIVARACGDHGVRLCYVSSSEVYGPSEWLPQAWSDTHPINMYGWSKLWGEQVSGLYAPEGLVVARLNMPYGPGPSSGWPLASGRNALHTFLWLAHHRQPIHVHRGTLRSFTWAGDAARGLRLALEQPKAAHLNVCRNDDLRDMEQVARLACDLAGAPHTLIVARDPPAGVTPVKVLDDQPLRELGWAPEVGLEDGAARTFEWIKRFDVNGRWVGEDTSEGAPSVVA